MGMTSLEMTARGTTVTSIAICQRLDLVRSEKWWKGRTIHMNSIYNQAEELVIHELVLQ